MISRKHLEIQLSQVVEGFRAPKIEFEQYQTPPRVAANLLHIASTRDDIIDKKVVDLCAGTGILGIGAALIGADVTLVEKESDAFQQLLANVAASDTEVKCIQDDVLSWKTDSHFDTAILNPPFGIQQKKLRDMDFVLKASTMATEIYSVHDGSPTNQENLPKLFRKHDLEIKEAYIEEFPLDRSYPWHSEKRKFYQVLIVHSSLL